MILPLIKRELWERSRGPAIYWTRFAVALVGMLICLTGLSIGGFTSKTSMVYGEQIFDGLVGLIFFLNCAMCLLAVDAISRERREGTFELLFLTRINSLELLIGKFGAAGLTGLCGLVALFPVLMIPVMAGGVTGGEAFRKSLILVDTLTLSVAVGLWASARGRNWARTTWVAFGFLAALVFGPLILGDFLLRGTVFSKVALMSPLALLKRAGDLAYTASEAPYWAGLVTEQIFAWGLLWHAGKRLDYFALNEGPKTSPTGQAVLEIVPYDPIDEPIEYLMRYRWHLKAIIWSAAILGVAYHLIVIMTTRGLGSVRLFGFGQAYFMTFSVAVSLVEGPLFAWAACRFFLEARREGELELLLTTPVGAQKIISSQWGMLKRFFVWAILLLISPILIRLALVAWNEGVSSLPGWRLQNGVFYLVAIINIVCEIGAICWLGLWFGYKSRGTAAAILKTVCLAKGVPYLISQLMMLFWTSSGFTRVIRFSPHWLLTSFASQLLVMIAYLWMIHYARRKLRQEFPEAEGLNFKFFVQARKGVRWLRSWPRPIS